ncbi:MAG: 2Fe-2S iron-sulfur cluster-binding protein [Chitinophagales bacterium]
MFHTIKIKKVNRETKDAVSVVLDIPTDLKNDFQYTAGQYITFKIDVNGEECNRSYSLCSSTYLDEEPTIAIKEVKGGKVSTYFNQKAKDGDVLEAMSPMGNFKAEMDAANENHYILFGGGSGITPLFSILKSVLKAEPKSKITLFFANYNSDAVIFKNELTQIAKDNTDRFKMVHVFDQPVKKGGFLGFGKKSVEELPFVEGRMTEDMCLKLLREHTDLNFQKSVFYMCGPGGLMDNVGKSLATLGISSDKINREYFTEKSEDSKQAVDVGTGSDENFDGTSTVELTYDGTHHTFTMKDDENVLDAALDANVDPPFACMVGACTSCRAKLVEGSVHMDDRDALTDKEVAAGYILTCQAHPKSSKLKITYDE